jgi:hypothetical protein
MKISSNLMRIPVDGTDAQSRGGQDGTLSDGAPGGFDDVLTQVNRPETSTVDVQGGSGGQSDMSNAPARRDSFAELLSKATTNGTSTASSAQGSATTTSFASSQDTNVVPVDADLKENASASAATPPTSPGSSATSFLSPTQSAVLSMSMPASVSTPAPVPASTSSKSVSTSASISAARSTASAEAAALFGDLAAGSDASTTKPVSTSATPVGAAVNPATLSIPPLASGGAPDDGSAAPAVSVAGDQITTTQAPKAATTENLVLAAVAPATAMQTDLKPTVAKAAANPSSSTGVKSSAKDIATDNPATTSVDPNAAMNASAVLASLLGIQPQQANTKATRTIEAPTLPKTAKPPAGPQLPQTDPDDASDLSLASNTDSSASDDASPDTLLSSKFDAQIASRPAASDLTPVSVVSQATFFPTVSGLSIAQQLADPIADAAGDMANVSTPAAAAPTVTLAAAPIRTLDVTLSPGSLGNVKISMRLVDGNLHLGVEAEDANTARLIDRDKATLATALHASGYTVADLNIVHGAGAGAQTQSDNGNAGSSQDQRYAADDQARSSGQGNASGNNGRGDEQGFSRDRTWPSDGRANGDVRSDAPGRSDGGVFL